MKYLSILLIISGLVISSCKKEEPPKPLPPTKKELISKTWKIKKVLQDDYESNDPYWKTVVYEFIPDGTYILTDYYGSTSGDWMVNPDATKLIKNKGTSSEDIWDVLAITETELRIKRYNNSTYEITYEPK